MRERGLDYFENSRRATLVHQQYAIRNPLRFDARTGSGAGASQPATARATPRSSWMASTGVSIDYVARGAPFGPDDGTIAPWSVVASLPFAPEIVLPTIRYFIEKVHLKNHPYGFEATFNATYPGKQDGRPGWVSPWTYGLNQGPIVLMIENHRSGFFWDLMKRCPPIREGLRRAGFTGGWLSDEGRRT